MDFVSSSVSRQVDLECERIGISTQTLMENAGHCVAQLVSKLSKGPFLALAGPGNNGGDSLVAARLLIGLGYQVDFVVAGTPKGLCQLQLEKLEKIKKKISNPRFENYDLIIDGLLGTSITGNPRKEIAELILKANSSGKKILSVDLPSGLDPNSGIPYEPCIKASFTISLAVMKKGMNKETSPEFCGKLFIGNILVPNSVYKKLGIINPFSDSKVLFKEK